MNLEQKLKTIVAYVDLYRDIYAFKNVQDPRAT